MRQRVVLPLVLSLCTQAGAFAAVDVAATQFDIRHDADELIEDLHNHRGEAGVLLQRVQNLISEHADSMITKGDYCAKLSDFFMREMKEAGLADEFVKTFSAPADRHLQELIAANAADGQFEHLALSYPLTPAATQAWRHIANHAWDSGRIGQYLESAFNAGDAASKPLAERVTAALQLQAKPPSPELPVTLDGLDEMWHITIEDLLVHANAAERQGHQPHRGHELFALANGPGDLTAASDGTKFFIFDRLVGRIQGEARSLGVVPLSLRQAMPVVSGDHFIAMGWMEDHATLMCLNQLGEMLWHSNTQSLGHMRSLSAPLVLDDQVMVATLVIDANQAQEQAELRVLGFNSATGKPTFNTIVARIPIPRQIGFGNQMDGFSQPPSIAIQGGYLLVMSNSGVLARVNVFGQVERLWSYPSSLQEIDDGLSLHGDGARQGSLVSDGVDAVACPGDNPGLVLLLSMHDPEPRRYSGDGANGDVLDVAHGNALLGGPSSLVVLDLASMKTRWSQAFGGKGGMQGVLGPDRVLVSSHTQMGLFDLANGAVISSRGIEGPLSMSVTPDLLTCANETAIFARSKGTFFLDRLIANAKAHPTDYRPWVTIASYQETRDTEQAFANLVQALNRGAPSDYAERAARLIRGELEIAAGTPAAFAAPIAKLGTLIPYDSRFQGEVALWNARNAELSGQSSSAIDFYRAASSYPSHLVLLKDNVEVDIDALAQAGIFRLTGRKPAQSSNLPPDSAPLPLRPTQPARPWTSSLAHCKPTIQSANLAIGYANGFLSAISLVDGSLAWRRTPQRPMLGVSNAPMQVQINNNNNGDSAVGIPLDVVPGSSAAGAGLESGDLITAFQGHPTVDYNRDVRGAVLAMHPLDPFIMSVIRNGTKVELKGILGGEPMAPLQVNGQSVLSWLVGMVPMHRNMMRPEGMWFSVEDLATGETLLRHSLQPSRLGESLLPPLLANEDLVLTIEGDELICLPVRGNKDPLAVTPLWRLPMGTNGIDQVHLLGQGLVWMPDDGRDRINIIDIHSGKIRIVLPEDVSSNPFLVDNQCFCLGAENQITCWDLGLGRLVWRTAKTYARLITVGGDAIVVLNDNNQLTVLNRANGSVRRLYGDWLTIQDLKVDGNRLALMAERLDRTQSLIQMTLPSGTVLWEHPLPHGQEVHELVVAPDAIGCVMSQNSSDSALLSFTAMGDIHQACLLKHDEDILPVAGTMLGVSLAGMRTLPSQLPGTGTVLHCADAGPAGPGKDLMSVVTAALPTLQWQSVGNASYALLRWQGSLLVFGRVTKANEPLELRISDDEPLIDMLGQSIFFQMGGPLLPLGQGWRAINHLALNSADANLWTEVVQLDPPPTRVPGSRLLVRAASAGQSDGGDAPWWLHQGWRPVTGGP